VLDRTAMAAQIKEVHFLIDEAKISRKGLFIDFSFQKYEKKLRQILIK